MDAETDNAVDIDCEVDENLPKEEEQPTLGRQDTDPVEQVRIEDLPLQKRIELAKNIPNPFGSIKPGLWVDALDSINSWCASKIIDVDDNLIKVHFDGWPHKWDEWMKITSYKVNPFRKHSVGYTGQTKIAIRKLDLTESDYLSIMDKMDDCIKNNLKGLGAIETTQFYRGHIFSLLDHLMGKTYDGTGTETFEIAIKFIKKTIELIIAYIKRVPSMLQNFEDFKIEPDLYLIDEDISIAVCNSEFSEMLKTIFCMNARCLRFYLKHDRPPQDLKTTITKEFLERDIEMMKLKYDDLEFDDIKTFITTKKDIEFGLFFEFVDHFHYHGGFDAVRNALRSITKTEGGKALPLNVIPDLTSPFRNCRAIIDEEYAKEMAEEVQQLVLQRLENMTDDEMKDLDKSTIHDLLTEIREFLLIALDDHAVDEKLETVKLSMALRFLSSSNMKKRLNGINEIKTIIEMTSDHMHRGWRDDDSPRRAKWLKPEFLCNWIHENRLLELLLGESSHIEVVKRSTTVLKFLSLQKQLTMEHLDLLWKCQEGKHEATVMGVFETIIEISIDLSIEALDYIYSKIETIPLKKYNVHTLNFVRDFTINACRVISMHSQKELLDLDSDNEVDDKANDFYLENCKGIVDGDITPPNDFGSEYGTPKIWELLHQASELGTLALNAFLELMKSKYLSSFRMDYIMRSIKNLQLSKAVYQSLTILINVLPKKYETRRNFSTNKLQYALCVLHREFDLIALTIQNIEIYNALVQKSMVESINKGVVLENIPKTCFEGSYTHSDQLDKRLEFIEFLIYSAQGEIELGNSTIDKLWSLFVRQGALEFDTNLFFKWLNKEKYQKAHLQGKDHRKIFTSEEREYLLVSILCNAEIADMQK